jgi:hypothetical protein
MARRLLKACWCAALLAPLGLAARGSAKPPDLPLEPQDAVRPQLLDPDAVGNEDAAPTAGFLPPAHQLRPADFTPVPLLPPIVVEEQPTGELQFGLGVNSDIGLTGVVVVQASETPCEPAAPRRELLPVPSLYKLRPSVRRRVIGSLLFSAHPLMALTPTDKLLDCPSDHPQLSAIDTLLERMCEYQVVPCWGGPRADVDPEAVALKQSWHFFQGDGEQRQRLHWRIVTKAVNMGLPVHVWRFSLPEHSPLACAAPATVKETPRPDSPKPSCTACPGMCPRPAERHVYQFTASDLSGDVLHNLEKLQAAHRLMHLGEHLVSSGRVWEALDCFDLVCRLCPGRFECQVAEVMAQVFSPVYKGAAEDAEEGECEELPPPKEEPEGKATDKEREIERRLSTPVNVNFTDMPLRAVIDDIRSWQGINIYIDEPALVSEGISLDRPITIKLEQVSLKSALNLLLHQAHLVYIIKDEVLQITTPAFGRGKLITATYQVADLVRKVRSKTARRSDVESLIRIITSAVEPRSWAEQGGSGTIDYHAPSRSLVINHTADVQEQIADLLATLRRHMKKQAAPQEDAPCPSACPKCEKLHAARAKGVHEQVEGLMCACRLAAEAGRHAKAAELARQAYALDAERVMADPLVYKLHLLALQRDKGKARPGGTYSGAEHCEPACPWTDKGNGLAPGSKDDPEPDVAPTPPPVDADIVGALERLLDDSQGPPYEGPHYHGVSLHGRYFDVDCSWTGLRMRGQVPLRGALYHLQYWNGAVSGWVTPNPADLTPERVDGAIQ